eukprot:5213732-Amphidinium_carterae.1
MRRSVEASMPPGSRNTAPHEARDRNTKRVSSRDCLSDSEDDPPLLDNAIGISKPHCCRTEEIKGSVGCHQLAQRDVPGEVGRTQEDEGPQHLLPDYYSPKTLYGSPTCEVSHNAHCKDTTHRFTKPVHKPLF